MPPWTPWFNNADYHSLLQNPGGNTALPTKTEGFADNLWSAVIEQYIKALRIRRLIFEASALFIGRAPMTSNIVAGGVTVDHSDAQFAAKCDTFKNIMEEVAEFIVKEYVPVALALGALYQGYDNGYNGGQGWGGGLGNYLSWGGYPQVGGGIAIKGGKVDNLGTPDVFMSGHSDLTTAIGRVKDGLKEYITWSRYKDDLDNFGDDHGAYPGAVTRTEVDREGNADAYSYLKAPRFDGLAREVGPMARMFVNGWFQDGVELATSLATSGLGGLAGYDAYVNNAHGVNGLKPSMIGANLAVALVRDGLATLTTAGGVVDAAAIAGLTQAQIAAAYTDDNVITGTVADWVLGLTAGKSTMDRLRARALESLLLIQRVAGPYGDFSGGWIDQVKALAGQATFIPKPTPMGVRSGFGCIEAPRGALAHFSSIDKGKITAYQCVVPYTWNGSPRSNAAGNDRGATEEALIGVPFANNPTVVVGPGIAANTSAAGGVEVLRVCQSFDPCLACAVQ
jgi:Ni,Fe-hydrogenase I large subunit